MGSSKRKRKERRSDFQKPKLRVGKARPKPPNFTDTSFSSKAITLKLQSIMTTKDHSHGAQINHHLTFINSKADSQRRDSIDFIATAFTHAKTSSTPPQAVSVVLLKMLPLTTDTDHGIRTSLLKFLSALTPGDVEQHVEKIMLYIRLGLTHLSLDIRSTTLDMLVWALECNGDDLVSCKGGWFQTLESLMIMVGWSMEPDTSGWTSVKTSFVKTGLESKVMAKTLSTMALFIRTGLHDPPQEETPSKGWGWPLTHTEQHMISKKSNAYAHLNLFGPPLNEKTQMYADKEDRQRIFANKFQVSIEGGLATVKQEGGAVGRAAADIEKAIRDGMKDFEA
ncbi:MAG: hypothetical protein Q9166_002798 [cf. Caloplaca sp. 2 TL-2023]